MMRVFEPTGSSNVNSPPQRQFLTPTEASAYVPRINPPAVASAKRSWASTKALALVFFRGSPHEDDCPLGSPPITKAVLALCSREVANKYLVQTYVETNEFKAVLAVAMTLTAFIKLECPNCSVKHAASSGDSYLAPILAMIQFTTAHRQANFCEDSKDWMVLWRSRIPATKIYVTRAIFWKKI